MTISFSVAGTGIHRVPVPRVGGGACSNVSRQSRSHDPRIPIRSWPARTFSADTRSPIGMPVLTYKVYVADGREELIRGAFAQGIPIRSLRQIEAVGNDSFVVNRLSGGDLPTPTSIVAPSVLLEEMELKRPTGNQQKPALLTHPFFSKN